MRPASLVTLALLLSPGRAWAQDEPAQPAPAPQADPSSSNPQNRENTGAKTTPPSPTPSYPKSGSQPGSALEAYRERPDAPAASADQARGWSEEPGVDPADQALFAPRALLFVPKVVFQLVFFPIQALLTVVDRHHVIPRVRDLFYFDRAHTAGFYPSVALESGYGLSYGAGVFHNDAFGHGEELVASGRFGGSRRRLASRRFGGHPGARRARVPGAPLRDRRHRHRTPDTRARAAQSRAGLEHQRSRRSAELDLVYQPHRGASGDAGRGCPRQLQRRSAEASDPGGGRQ